MAFPCATNLIALSALSQLKRTFMNKQDPFPAVCPLKNEVVEFGLLRQSVVYRNLNFKIFSFFFKLLFKMLL